MEYARNEKENRHVETPDEIPYKPIFQSQVIDNHQNITKTLAKSSHSIPFLVIFSINTLINYVREVKLSKQFIFR